MTFMRYRRKTMTTDPRASSMERATFWLSVSVLVVSQILCNGPDGIAGSVIAQTGLLLLSIALLATCTASLRGMRLSGADRLLAILLSGIVLLAMIQLVPLPPAVWKSLAGRSGLSVEMQTIGVGIGWRPISLSPVASERCLLALLPAIAIFLAARSMSKTGRKRLVQGVVALGLISALLGIAQVGNGPDSDLRLYRPSNLSDAIGFFANRNHYGSMLAMLLPFSISWTFHEFQRRGESGRAGMIRILLSCLVTFLFVIGILLSHSRAGLLLTAIAGLGSMALLWRSGAGGRIILAVGICGILGGILALEIAGNDVVSRLTALDLGSDTRWPVQATTIDAVHRYGAFGSGLGTFVSAYQSVAPDYQIDQNAYVNHANNDYLELLLEAGWPAAVLIAGFFAWYGWEAIPLWRAGRLPTSELMMARAASLSILLALVHAGLEYQLRKPAIMVLFGLCCALLSAQARRSGKGDPGPRLDDAIRQHTQRPTSSD